MSAKADHIKVLLVDDHALFREGVAEIFVAEDDLLVAGEAENSLEAVALAERERPDVVLLDVEMPVMGAEKAIERILRASPSSKVLVLTMYDEPRLVRKLLTLGAHGYIVKNATREELVAAVRTIHRVEDRVVLSVSRNTADRLEGSEKGKLSTRELDSPFAHGEGDEQRSDSLLSSHLGRHSQAPPHQHLREAGRQFQGGCRKESPHERADNVQGPLRARPADPRRGRRSGRRRTARAPAR